MKAVRILFLLLLFIGSSMTLAGANKESPDVAGHASEPRWAGVMHHYWKLGEHRSGSETDQATARWLVQELSNVGLEAMLQTWPLRVFHLKQSRLQVGAESFDSFPFWFPRQTDPEGIQAPLVLMDESDDTDLAGAIALVLLPPDQYKFHYDVAPTLKRAEERGALGAVVLLNHPLSAVSAQNANRPWHQQELPIPALIGAYDDAEKLLSLAEAQATAKLVIDGVNRPGEASNVLAKIDRGSDHWLVISTPTSGWFEVTNERGPGIAMWLELAEWLLNTKLDANVLLVALSGHELAGMGMQALVDSGELPHPQSVKLWLHLGSGIAVQTPLLAAVSSVNELAGVVQQTLVASSTLQYWPEEKTPKGSEQYAALKLGYPVVGLFGGDPAIHTRLDQQPRVDDKEFGLIRGALQALIKRVIAQNLTKGPDLEEE